MEVTWACRRVESNYFRRIAPGGWPINFTFTLIPEIEIANCFWDSTMLDVLTFDPVIARPASAPPPHYCERPRVSLESGRVVAHTLHFSTGVPASVALDLACTLARSNRTRISVPVAGPLHSLPDLVSTALLRAGLSPDRLEIAIGGTVLQQAGIEALLALSALRDDGVDVALTGFGQSRIDLISRLPLSAVMLAPTALRDVPGSAAATASLRDLLSMAADHGLRVTATGITSESQRALLSGLGAEDGEGMLFGLLGRGAAAERILAEA